MNKAEIYDSLNLDEVEVNSNKLFRDKIESFGMKNDIMAHLLNMPLSTFNDKLSGRTQWKLKEFAYMCILLNVTSDEALFGNALYVTKYNQFRLDDLKENIKEFLIREKNYKTYGKLDAEGFFNDKKKVK